MNNKEVVLPNNSDANIALTSLAEHYLKEEEEEGKGVDTQYAYELLMELVYGAGVFDYINSLPHNS